VGDKLIREKSTKKFKLLETIYPAMPPSQLKRLKASLREQGIVGPQKSKKQKKQNIRNGADKEKRVQRTAALNELREQFNPFEYRMPAKSPKFEVTTNSSIEYGNGKGVARRPGVAKDRDHERVWQRNLNFFSSANIIFIVR
jgi:hypothetical protein